MDSDAENAEVIDKMKMKMLEEIKPNENESPEPEKLAIAASNLSETEWMTVFGLLSPDILKQLAPQISKVANAEASDDKGLQTQEEKMDYLMTKMEKVLQYLRKQKKKNAKMDKRMASIEDTVENQEVFCETPRKPKRSISRRFPGSEGEKKKSEGFETKRAKTISPIKTRRCKRHGERETIVEQTLRDGRRSE